MIHQTIPLLLSLFSLLTLFRLVVPLSSQIDPVQAQKPPWNQYFTCLLLTASWVLLSRKGQSAAFKGKYWPQAYIARSAVADAVFSFNLNFSSVCTVIPKWDSRMARLSQQLAETTKVVRAPGALGWCSNALGYCGIVCKSWENLLDHMNLIIHDWVHTLSKRLVYCPYSTLFPPLITMSRNPSPPHSGRIATSFYTDSLLKEPPALWVDHVFAGRRVVSAAPKISWRRSSSNTRWWGKPDGLEYPAYGIEP